MSQRKISELPDGVPQTTDYVAFAAADGIAKKIDIKKFLETGLADSGGSNRAPVFIGSPVATVADLPAVGIPGELRMVGKNIYGWDEITQTWILGGDLSGPPGQTLRISSSVNSADLLDPRPALLTVTLTTTDKTLWIYSPTDTAAAPGPATAFVPAVPGDKPGDPDKFPAHPAQPPAGWVRLGAIDGPPGPQGVKGDPGIAKGTVQNQILRWSVADDKWIGGAAPTTLPSGDEDGNTIQWNEGLSQYDSVPFPKSVPDGNQDGDLLTWDYANQVWITTDNRLLDQVNINNLQDPSADSGTLIWDQTNQVWDTRRLTTADISDIDTSVDPNDGDYLQWDDTAKKWVSAELSLPAATRFRDSVNSFTDLDGIPDLQVGDVAATKDDGMLHVYTDDGWDIIGPTSTTLPDGLQDGNVLTYDSASGNWYSNPLPDPIADGQNVGEVLAWDGNEWAPKTLAAGDLSDFAPGPYTGGNTLMWNSSTLQWEEGKLAFHDLSDFDGGKTPLDKQTLAFDGTAQQWTPTWFKLSELSDVALAAGHPLTVNDVLVWKGTRWEINAPEVTKTYVDSKLSSVLALKPGVADKTALDALDVTKNVVGDTRFTNDTGQMYIWDGTAWDATGKPSTLIPTGTNDGEVLTWDLATKAWVAKAPVAGRTMLSAMLDTNFDYTDTRHGAGVPHVGNSLIWTDRPVNKDPAAPKTGAWVPGSPHPQLREWNQYTIYYIDDLVYHKGRLWRATPSATRNRAIEPDIVDGDCVAFWNDARGVGSGPRLVEKVNIVTDPGVAPATPALPSGQTVHIEHVYLQYVDDTNWAVWHWENVPDTTSTTPALVWQWTKIAATGGSQVWRNVALPSPNPTPSSVTLWIFGLEGHTTRPIASKIGWQPVALGDFLISLADVQATGANSGDLLISNGAGRWIASPNPSYTKAEADKKIGDLVLGLEHGEAVQSITNTPPTTPVADEFYIVGLAPTGAWVGHSNAVAWWNGTAWQFQVPQQNESHLVEDQDGIFHWNGTTWVKVASASAGSTASSGVGEIIPWLADVVPDDYLPCDGRIVSIASYADLHAVIQNKYNTGTAADGTTTFALPDLRDYFVRGVNSSGNPAVGTKHDWTTGKPRSNFTTDNPGNHQHTLGQISTYGAGSGGTEMLYRGDNVRNFTKLTDMGGAHSHTVTGGGDAETAPKHFICKWLIRTKAINGGARGPQGAAGVGMPTGTAANQIPVYNGTVWQAQSTTSVLAPITYTKSEADAKFALAGTSNGIQQMYIYHSNTAGSYGIAFGTGLSPANFVEMDGSFQPASDGIPCLVLQFDGNTLVFDSSTVDDYSFVETWSSDGDKRTGHGHVSMTNLKGILSTENATRFAKAGKPAKLKISAFKINNYYQILWTYYRHSDNDTPMVTEGSMQVHTTSTSNAMTFFGIEVKQGSSPANQAAWQGNFIFRWK